MSRTSFRLAVLSSVMACAVLFAGAGSAAGRARAAADGSPVPRLVFISDGSGSAEGYSVDPARPGSPAQLTFGHEASCEPLLDQCGYENLVSSPDGRQIAYTAHFGYQGCRALTFVARADGRGRRRLGRETDCVSTVVWSPDSRQLVYQESYFLHLENRDGTHRRLIPGASPQWSPDSRSLAFLSGHNLVVLTGNRLRFVAAEVERYAWSPDGRWFAVEIQRTGDTPEHVDVMRADGSNRHRLSDGYDYGGLSWSGDGRFVAFKDGDLKVVEVATGASRAVEESYPDPFAWSRTSHRLAFVAKEGLSLLDPVSGETTRLSTDRALDLAWAPGDRSIAYVAYPNVWPLAVSGDIRIASLDRKVETVVSAAGAAGGAFNSLQWTTPRGSVHFRPLQPRAAATVSADRLVARWPIERIAADGDQVAYSSCGHLFVWTPATQTVVQAETASLSPRCSNKHWYLPFELYNFALAGDRIAVGSRDGNMSQGWELVSEPWRNPSEARTLAEGYGYAGCTVGGQGLGDLVGAGDLLVFSRWTDVGSGCGVTTGQDIYRVDPGGCPCPRIGSSPGPLIPMDVDLYRVVAVGTNATLVLSQEGTQLLSVPTHAVAAQLDGSHLVTLAAGQLRDYDAANGTLLHAWPLPDVPSGGGCGSPHPWACPAVRLELVDAAHGLAAYVLDGSVHVIRLSDGADAEIGKGTTARFMNLGLVYADGARLQIKRYAELPAP